MSDTTEPDPRLPVDPGISLEDIRAAVERTREELRLAERETEGHAAP